MPPPTHVSPLVCRMARIFINLIGWRAVGDPNRVPKAVVIAAPHTSNWDGLLAIAGGYALDARFRWMGKDSLFRFPLSLLTRPLGGIPIDRSSPHNMVDQMVEVFARNENLFLIIAPEGTRKRAEFWKSGFYHIALGANVPLLFAYIDYAKKEIGVDKLLYPSGDIDSDMTIIQAYYRDITPRHAERKGEIRLQAK